MTIMMPSGERISATRVRHLRTLTNGSGRDNTDVELYRTRNGQLVVCTSPANDCRVAPCVDPDSTPADYGVAE
jgi:hypothetical protein